MKRTPLVVKRILCPIDFSDASTHVVEQAVALARWYHARITALHVYSPLVAPIPTLPPPVERVPQTAVEQMQESTRACFHAAAAAGVGVDVAVDIGDPAVEILDRAAKLPADLIVMGTHGAGGFERLVLGSVAEKVLRRAGCPVLTVPPRAHTTAVLPFARVLCAVDFSDPSHAALQYAWSMADEPGSTVTLLHVLEWPWKEPPAPLFEELPPEQAARLAEFRKYLETTASARLKSLVPDGAQCRCTFLTRLGHGKPYVQILRLAEEDGVDLIAIGVHGRNLVDRTLFGSTTNHVVRGATCPVLTLKQ